MFFLLLRCVIRGSAIAEGPRDVPCQLKTFVKLTVGYVTFTTIDRETAIAACNSDGQLLA